MTKIVDFCDVLNQRLEEEKLVSYYNNHDEVLDLLEDVFPEGAVVVAIDDKELQLSSTITDRDSITSMLFAALKTVEEEK